MPGRGTSLQRRNSGQVQSTDGFVDIVGRSRAAEKPRPDPPHGNQPRGPIQIEANTLSHPDDLRAAIACVELCREIGNSSALGPHTKREIMPGALKGSELENFIRDAAITYHHQTCTAKMGRDSASVVDARLRVYGIENLRIADGSIMPRVMTGNIMAPCVVIGERAAEVLRNDHRLETSSVTNTPYA
jgi:choline dehydrogenase